jgi:hypothetical protein
MRNAIYLSVAYSMAVEEGAGSVVAGTWTDRLRDEHAYPDTSTAFLEAFESFAERACGYRLWEGEQTVTSLAARNMGVEASVTSCAARRMLVDSKGRLINGGPPSIGDLFKGLDKGAILRTARNCGIDLQRAGRVSHTSYDHDLGPMYLLTATDQTRTEAYIEAGEKDPACAVERQRDNTKQFRLAKALNSEVWPLACIGRVHEAMEAYRTVLHKVGGLKARDIIV